MHGPSRSRCQHKLNAFSLWKYLMLPELVPTPMNLELANRSVAYPAGIAEDVFVQVGKFMFPTDFIVIDYYVDPRVPLILGRPFLRTARALVDVYGEKLTLRVSDEKLIFNVESTSKYHHKHRYESITQIDIIDTRYEDHFYEVLNVQKSIHPLSDSPTPSDLVVASFSSSLTPFRDSDFLLEETNAFLALDDSIPPKIDNGVYDSKGDILFLEKLLNDDPIKDLPLKELKNDETKMTKSLIKEPPNLELKDLPPHLEYAFLEGTLKLPVIIAKNLREEENDQLIERRVNLKIHEVIKVEVIKLLNAGLIYPISNSPWVSPMHVVPKKGGMTVVTNYNNELTLTRLVMGWRVCIDYRKLNDVTHQEKNTFTCPYRTFAYRRMPFGLCNALKTFQRGMVAIFHDMIEKTMDVFMDDFLVFGDSFSSCLSHLDMMLKRYEDTNISKDENLAADHLSRLENPYKGNLIEMEVNDNFPHDSLNMISFNDENEPLWSADIANYPVGGVWMGRKLLTFLKLATMALPVDIMAQTTSPRMFSTLVSFGPLYIVIPMTWSNTVTHVNVNEKSQKGMKCPRILSRFVRSLTYGASALWGGSRPYEEISILVAVDYVSKWVGQRPTH
nr:reverse transcriptase domain-containing protein [Tanacetum cinerariifolium]